MKFFITNLFFISLFLSGASALDLTIGGNTSPLSFSDVNRVGINITNVGDDDIGWVAKTNVDWASVEPSSGNIKAGRMYPFMELLVEQNPTNEDRAVEISLFHESDIDEIDPVSITIVQEGNYNGENYPPVLSVSGENPDTVVQGDTAIFISSATDLDGQIDSYSWEFELYGVICQEAECQIDSLSLGRHRFVVTATDNDGGVASVSGEVYVKAPVTNKRPVAVIESISPTKSEAGETVTLSGGGTDPDGDETVTGYEWTSDIDGVICEEKTCSIDNLSVETHTISLRVQDSEGEWSFRVEHDEQIVVDEKVSVFTNNMLSKNIDWRGNQLQITAGSSSWAVVDIFNFHGTKVANVSQHIYPGKNTLSFGEEIPQGYYFLVINVNNSVRNKLVFFTEE